MKVDFVLGRTGDTWGRRDFLGDSAYDLTKKEAIRIARRYRARGYFARIIKRRNGWKVMRSFNKANFYRL